MEFRLTLPLKIHINKRKTWTLNLNQYRNAHHHVLSSAKKKYSKHVKELILEKYGLKPPKFKKPVCIYFIYYHGSKVRVDTANPCSIIDKFFCDAVTDMGIWPDDNAKWVKASIYQWGGVDTLNPRCEVIIKQVKK